MVQGIASLGANDQMMNSDQAPPASGSGDVVSSLGKAFSSLSAKELAELKSLSDQLMQMPPEQLKALAQVIEFIQRKSDQYDIAVQTLIRQGIVEAGDLPPEYIPAFFDILGGLVQDAMSKVEEPRPSDLEKPAFAKGGIAELKKAGRYGDTTVAHLSPKSAAILKRNGGSGTINPKTGLVEYGLLGDIFGGIGKFIKGAAGVVLPVALNFAFPGLGTIASGAIGAGLGAMINGASPGQALGAALTGGIGGALVGGVGGLLGGQGFMSGVTGALPAGFAGSTNTQPYLASWLGGQAAPTGAPGASSVTGMRSEAAMDAATGGGAAGAAGGPGILSKVGGWMAEHPYYTAAGAALAGTALGSSLAESKGGEKATMPGGATPEMIAAARFPAGTFTSRAAPKIELTPTYSPAYARGGDVKRNKGKEAKTTETPATPAQAPLFPAGTFALRGPAPTLGLANTYSPAYAGGYVPTFSPAYAMGGETDARGGGHLEGPGTGTSDSIPAKLSDGEFVMTAKAVRGAGDGSRKKGARKMYDLMHQFEKRA